ncbi:MAG: PTS sugar transporter subunit IIA [Oscillospiraceae bacterium]|nr:PTS sugar transporter subunit IIA [Oscillospiraceae bacterium]
MIQRDNIRAQVLVLNWRDAIRNVGALLIDAKSITSDYVDGMIQAVEEMGPYIVIMPGFAIAHAAPSEAVLKNDTALITLKEGVNFGSPNDPVYLVFCLCCTDRTAHRASLQEIAKRLLAEGVMERIKNAQSVDEIMACL